MDNKKKLVIWILFFVTIILGSSAVYIGYRLREEPEITPQPIDAQLTVVSCAEGGVVDTFSSYELNTQMWLPITTSSALGVIDIADNNLQLNVVNLDDTTQNSSGIQTKNLYTGDFMASVVLLGGNDFENIDGSGTIFSLTFNDNAGIRLFGIDKQVLYENGIMVESVIAYIGDKASDEIRLESGLTELKIDIKREGNIVSIYISSNEIGTIEVFSDVITESADGKIKLNYTTLTPGIQNARMYISNFEITCVGDVSEIIEEERFCTCEDGIVSVGQCGDDFEPICNLNNGCDCNENMARPLATIIIPSTSVDPVVPTVSGVVVATRLPGDNIVNINQEVEVVCENDAEQSIATQIITLTNNTDVDVYLSVDAHIDAQIKAVILDTISHGGLYTPEFSKLEWNSLDVLQVGEKMILSFQMLIPDDISEGFTNEITVYESKDSIGTVSKSFKAECLPDTALVSEEIDRLIIATCLIIAGYIMFASDIRKQTGGVFWDLGGKQLLSRLNTNYAKELKEESKKSFENHVTNSIK